MMLWFLYETEQSPGETGAEADPGGWIGWLANPL